MDIQRIAAFADGDRGGNPAGVVIGDRLPSDGLMQSTAAEVGYSETVFAARMDEKDTWRVRYFSPETEVPFCGHATIALGAALTEQHGAGRFELVLNEARISVEGSQDGDRVSATLQSPPTFCRVLTDAETDAALSLFGLSLEQLDTRLPPAHIHGGADHLMLPLASRGDLASMDYDLETGRSFMNEHGLVTIMLVNREQDRLFHARNAFASGGVFEDPATGAAAAAFAGYLRDLPCSADVTVLKDGDVIEIIQGEDMGMRSVIYAEPGVKKKGSVRISGGTRRI